MKNFKPLPFRAVPDGKADASALELFNELVDGGMSPARANALILAVFVGGQNDAVL